MPMESSYERALADLKQKFGPKMVLTPEDIAPIIGASRQAQANLRSREAFPIKTKKLGGRVTISIYALARYISEEESRDIKGESPSPGAHNARQESPDSGDSKPRRGRGRPRKKELKESSDHSGLKASEIPYNPGRPSLGTGLTGNGED